MGKALTLHVSLWTGFGLLLALSVLLMWSPQTLALEPDAINSLSRADYTLRSCTLPLAILGFTAYANGKRIRAAFTTAMILFAGGFLSFFFYAIGIIEETAAWEAFSVLFPIGGGGLFVCYFLAFANLPREHVAIVTLAASAFPSVIVLPISILLTSYAIIALLGISFIAFAALSIRLSTHGAFSASTAKSERTGQLKPSTALTMAKPLICIVLCTLVVGMLRTQSFGSTHFETLANNVTCLTMPLSVLVLIPFVRLMESSAFIIKIYDALLPTTALLYLLLPLASEAFSAALFTAVMLIFFCISPLMIIMCVWFSSEYSLPRTQVYGVFSALFYASSATGSIIGSSIQSENGAYDTVQLLTIALVAIWILAMAAYAFGENRNQQKSISQTDVIGSLGAKLEYLQKSYGISERELEVVELMVKGRSATFIGETLFISKSTVQSHCKAVYKKLGIHSKQELISMVEEAGALQSDASNSLT